MGLGVAFVGGETFVNGAEVGIIGRENAGEFGVFVAGGEVGGEGEEKGNLEADLVVPVAIKDAVEFGVGEAGV